MYLYRHDQIQRRSRRREDDLDVEGTYINQRNKRFNRKIQRVRRRLLTQYFGEHTKELRENCTYIELTSPQWNVAQRTCAALTQSVIAP